MAGALTLFVATDIINAPNTAEAEIKNELTELLNSDPEATFVLQISNDEIIELTSTDYEIHLKNDMYRIFIDGIEYRLARENVFIKIQ